MPAIPSIRTSIENKEVLVLDEYAKNGTFRRDSRGRLITYAGGFSVVFPYETTTGEKWAFRCWHSDVYNSRKRYELISEAIKDAQLNFLCDFVYVDQGINVEGNIYPTTRMRWIEGVTIKEYICQNRNSKTHMDELANKFLKMIRELHLRSLAHGDLQHGNILVGNDHQIYLVDYDSFYCPKLKGEADNVTGLADYQHPKRNGKNPVSEKLDYFSELIIFLSIVAIAENPFLVDKYKVENADRLLFSKNDFDDIKHSEIYKDISSLGGGFVELLEILELYLKASDINDLRPFEEILLADKVVFTVSSSKAIRDKQEIVVAWQVPIDAEVLFEEIGNIDSRDDKKNGRYSKVLHNDTQFELTVISKDGIKIKKSILIQVFDECSIEFSADKYCVFPSLPVKLSWRVENANKVWLESDEVETVGSKVIKPIKDTIYVLQAQDEFGLKSERITIQMFPLKQMNVLFASPPNIVINQKFTIKQPKFYVNVRFPHIKIDWVRTEIPKVQSLTDLGIKVELSPPLPKHNFASSFKNVVNQIRKSLYARE